MVAGHPTAHQKKRPQLGGSRGQSQGGICRRGPAQFSLWVRDPPIPLNSVLESDLNLKMRRNWFGRYSRWAPASRLKHDPEKSVPVFPRDKREAFARRSCSDKNKKIGMTIRRNVIPL